jgi:N-methylhydantoinase B
MDPIELEILTSKLEAIGEEAGRAIEKTAISTIVSDAKDYSVTICDAAGNLVVATGCVTMHFGGSAHAVRSTLERYGDSIRPGDVFLANDPHNGGGLHPQDVVAQRPVFVDGELVAWSAISAHMMDMGGMAPGSWAPEATECYQEALRVPPIRLFRSGEEVTDVWDIFRNNVRIPEVIEMDMRSIVIGTYVVEQKVIELISAMGVSAFMAGIAAIDDRARRELRERVSSLADGCYRSVESVESGDDLLRIGCTLTVDADRLILDLTDAPPQVPSLINSKAYIIHSCIVELLHPVLAYDLPYTQALYDLVELRCRSGTIVDSRLPAAIGSAHMDCAQVVCAAAVHCLQLAIGASPDAAIADHVATPHGVTWGVTTWSYVGGSDRSMTFVLHDGTFIGTSAGSDRDGNDSNMRLLGTTVPCELTDVEVYEATYPILFNERRSRRGPHGSGRWRSGAGCHESFQVHGVDRFVGTIIGQRGWAPSMGSAGGSPGATTSLVRRLADGTAEPVPLNASGYELRAGESFEILCGSGGGFGDPLDRDPDMVASDVVFDRIDAEEAREFYGVVVRGDQVDWEATVACRGSMRAERLARAEPPHRAYNAAPTDVTGQKMPLYPGVVRRGSLAIAEDSGAVLATAPDHWTDGCPRIEQRLPSQLTSALVLRTYLDPVSGRALHVEAVPEGAERSFDVLPRHWTEAALATPELEVSVT